MINSFFDYHLIYLLIIIILSTAYDIMGPLGKFGVEVCIIGYLVGCCIAYVVVLGDLGPELLNALGFTYSVQASRIILMTGNTAEIFKFILIKIKLYCVMLMQLSAS